MTLRLDLAWLGAAEWVELARKGMRWAGVVGTGAHYGGVGWMEWERRRSRVRRHCYRAFSVQQPLRDLTAALQEFDPAILTGYPSALLQLAAEQQAGRLRLRPTVVQLAGESTSPEQRARIAAALGGALHDTYACSEFLGMTLDCREGWLHAMGDWVILEPVDAEMRPVPPGRFSSTVLLTNLANRVQPIIRYDLGDSIAFDPEPCACGRPFPALRVEGRSDDVLRLTDARGKRIELLPLALTTVVEEQAGIHQFQIIQKAPDALAIRLQAPRGTGPRVLRRKVECALRAYLDTQGLPAVALRFEPGPLERSAASGKLRRVVAPG
jgi:phenylacetate-coenzyme A ligase PaaK-like adenylate-forming protein